MLLRILVCLSICGASLAVRIHRPSDSDTDIGHRRSGSQQALGQRGGLPEKQEIFTKWFKTLQQVAASDFEKPNHASALKETKQKIVLGVIVSVGENKERPNAGITNRMARDIHR